MTSTFWSTFAGFIFTALMLAMFNSQNLQTWSFDLEPGPVGDFISMWAEVWHQWMVELGPAGITEEIRFWFSDQTGAF